MTKTFRETLVDDIPRLTAGAVGFGLINGHFNLPWWVLLGMAFLWCTVAFND